MILASIILFSFSILASLIMLFRKLPSENNFSRYSILIACRNEENNIETLIGSINQIDYPEDMFEVIIIDDASEDSTWEKLKRNGTENIKIYRLKEKSKEYKGKKAALKKAAELAIFDNFLFTDADCVIDRNMLHSYNRVLNKNTSVIVGRYKTHDAGALQSVIDLSSAISFALSIYLNKPFSASGMNWLVTRQAYDKAGGYSRIKDIIAGDDKHLLNLIVKDGGEVRFNPLSPVITRLGEKLSTNRLKRKYGKFPSNRPVIKVFMILIFVYFVGLPISLFYGKYSPVLLYITAMSSLWISSLFHFKEKLIFKDLLTFLLYPYLALYFTITGSLGNWEWKGQKQN